MRFENDNSSNEFRAKTDFTETHDNGAVFDAGATLETSTTTEFDPAIGAVVYLEYVGNSKLAGLGLSVTSLNIEEKNTGTSVDASRAELYYNWRF